MTKYVKELNHELVEPVASEFPGVPNALLNDRVLRKNGYCPRIGEPEPREGYTASPSAWHKVEQTKTRIEPRPYVVPDYEENPETHEQEKVGEHTEWRDTEITLDDSYWQVDAWEYHEIPAPEPPPLKRQFSKGDLLEALMALNLYDQAKQIYANDLDLQIAFAGFASIDMDYDQTKAIMSKYSDFFNAENVEALQRYITFGEVPNAQ